MRLDPGSLRGFRRRVAAGAALCFAGIAVFLVGFEAIERPAVSLTAIGVGLALIAAGLFLMHRVVRCPSCGGDLRPLSGALANRAPDAPKVRFCPWCGASLAAIAGAGAPK